MRIMNASEIRKFWCDSCTNYPLQKKQELLYPKIAMQFKIKTRALYNMTFLYGIFSGTLDIPFLGVGEKTEKIME